MATFVELGAAALGAALADLRGRQRSPAVVRARETLALLGLERYRLRVVDLAQAIDKWPDGVTKSIARASRRRAEDERSRLALAHLDHTIATTYREANQRR